MSIGLLVRYSFFLSAFDHNLNVSADLNRNLKEYSSGGSCFIPCEQTTGQTLIQDKICSGFLQLLCDSAKY